MDVSVLNQSSLKCRDPFAHNSVVLNIEVVSLSKYMLPTYYRAGKFGGW